MQYEIEDEEARRARRREMIEKGKRRNKRLRFIYGSIRKYGPYAAGGLVLLVLICGGIKLFGHGGKNAPDSDGQIVAENGNLQTNGNESAEGSGQAASAGDENVNPDGNGRPTPGSDPNGDGSAAANGGQTAQGGNGGGQISPAGTDNGKPAVVYTAKETEDTLQLGEEINSEYAIFVDAESGEILAEKGAHTIINPASMTKVLTVLVAAEHVTDLDDTFTITLNETDYSYVNDCSSVGFAAEETVTVRDLFYGTILPSGGDAAAGLATYVAGSREAFVDMMNDKLEELGLSDTAHVTNCVGLYDKEHYCTVYDMAMILQAAMDNEICREVLSAHTYTTSSTEQHPDGITISNWFLRRIEDKDTGGEVIAGKTGFVVQSRSCAASFGKSEAGKEYICVTASGSSSWKCIYDHVALYKKYSE